MIVFFFLGLFIASIVLFVLVVILLLVLVFRCTRDNIKMKNHETMIMTNEILDVDEKEALIS